MELALESKIEGLLFYKGEDVSIKELAALFAVTSEEIEQALGRLALALSGRGLVLVRRDQNVVLGIASGLSSLIESIRKDEIAKELSKAALETLSIILYKNGVARNEIDYIRGVNSSFILRNLLVRGLVERIADANDSRRILYRPTFDTLSYMGVSSIDQLPNYAATVAQLQEVIKETQTHD
jgi:segregation and condensation protein B